MERYPSQLPTMLIDSKSAQRVDPVERSQLDSGRSRAQRVFESTPTNIPFMLRMTRLQAFVFELWFDKKITSGVDWFEMPVKMSDGLKDRVVRFTSIYGGPNQIGADMWQVSGAIEVRDPISTGYPDDYVDFPDYILGSSLFDRIMNDYWPAA